MKNNFKEDITKVAYDYAESEYPYKSLSFDSTGKAPIVDAFIIGAKYLLKKLNAVFIEKELLDPVSVNGYAETVGPYYHVYKINDNLEKEELFVEKSGDIKEAARYAERKLDFDVLSVSYKENPYSFSSVSMPCNAISENTESNNGHSFKLTNSYSFNLTKEDLEEITNFINEKLKKNG